MTWRQSAAETIEGVIEEHGTGDPDQLLKAISIAYPFGERKQYPYKIWLEEVSLTMARVRNGTYTSSKDVRTFWTQEIK